MDLFGGDGKEQQDGAAAGEGEVDDLEIAWENLEVHSTARRPITIDRNAPAGGGQHLPRV